MNLFSKPLMGASLLLVGTLVLSMLSVPGCDADGSPQLPTPTRTAAPAPTRTPAPVASAFAGSYVGTYNVNYDPRSPLGGGGFSGALRFVVRADSTVVAQRLFPSSLVAEVGATGRVVGAQITASSDSMGFGLRSFSGRLQLSAGRATGSGEITVLSQSEVAYGTWQARRQP